MNSLIYIPGWVIAVAVVLFLALTARVAVVDIVPLCRKLPRPVQILGWTSLFCFFSSALLFGAYIMGWITHIDFT